jgi:hypothetical protein
MKIRDLIFMVGGAAFAFIVGIGLYVTLSTAGRPQPNVPTIAGQQVPIQQVSLNFTNRFDFHFNLSGTDRIFQDCRLIGFTGETTVRDNGFSSGYTYFQNWIVLEDRDGHRIYASPSEIEYIEDAGNHEK